MMTNDSHALRLAGLRLRTLVSKQISKLDAAAELARDHGSEFDVAEFGSSVGISRGSHAWVILTSRHEFGLGPAMIWALRNGATSLNIFTEHNAGDLARRADFFNFKIDIYEIASDLAVSPVLALPSAVLMKEISAADESFADFIRSSGAEITREHGVLAGEVCGLEVCRVVHETSDSQVVESRLEIGVGTHDRETFQLLHGRTATIESLRKVVDEVASKRIVGANPHPLNQLGRERLLRHLICASPHLVDADSLQTVAPPMPRANLKDQVPCCAVGISRNGQSLVAIFSIGIDPDVISFGADARQAIDAKAELIFVSPQRDIVPAIAQLAELLFIPARFVGCNLLDAPTRGRD
jgi:hypothetical protein